MWAILGRFVALFAGSYFLSSRTSTSVGPILAPSAPKFVSGFSLVPKGDVKVWQQNALKMDNKYFNGWFQSKGLIALVAAMVMIESSGGVNLERQVSARDTSYGPMQVTPYTAQDIYNRGYKIYQPTRTVLLTPVGGMYYGMAYIKILYEVYGFRSFEKITRAYNGGPGGTGLTQTLAHWNKVKQYIA